MGLQGKVAIVTGGATGSVGHRRRLAGDGAAVAVLT